MTMAAEVYTDKSEYLPGETVVIDGVTFWSSEMVTLQVTLLDGTQLPGEGGLPWDVSASGLGDFETYWNVDWEYSGDYLLVSATGQESGETATATILAPKTDLNQLHNGTATSPPKWANGDINSSSACYAEGKSVAYRYFIKRLDAGTGHFFTIQMEWTKDSIHALDYLTDYDATEDSAINLTGGPCGSIATTPPPGCSAPTASFAFHDFLNTANYAGSIPPDFFTYVNPGFVLDGPRNLQAYNCTIDSVGKYLFGGSAKDQTLEVTVYFTVDTTGSVGFFWGGHLAEASPDAWGFGNGAASVSGAPYHMRALSLDGGGGGNQDRSIQSAVICLPPSVGIVCSSDSVCNINGTTYVCRDTASTANFWTWTVINGTIVGPDNLDSVVYTVDAGLQPGDSVYIIVESCDSTSGCPGDFCCAYDSVAIPVAECNDPPEVSCPADTSIFLCDSAEICIHGFSYSDPNGNLDTAYATPGTLEGDSICFAPAEGVNTIILTAIDDLGATTECTTLVTVTFNDPPVASCPGDTSMFVCDLSPITLGGFGCSDLDDNLATCSVNNGSLSGDQVTFTPVEGVNTIILTATDDCGETDACTTVVTVDLNEAPVCNLPDDGNYFVCVDTTFSFPVSATDADGNLVGCSKTSGPGTLSGGYWTFTTTGPGVYSAVFSCNDECGATCGGTVNITVTYNQPPVASCPGDTSMFVCDLSPITLDGFGCSDPDDNLSTCSVNNGTLSGSQVTFTPVAGVNMLILTATDACGETDACTTYVTVTLNSPPVCNLPGNQSFFQCTPTQVCLPVSATDVDNNLVDCQIISGPGTLSGGNWCYTPAGDETVVVTIRCTDVCGAYCEGSFTIQFDMNEPPVVSCPNDTSVNFLCEPSQICYSSGFTATDADNNILTETVSLGTLSNGSVCFTPDTAGVYEIIYTVTDECGASDACTSYVSLSYTNQPPVASCHGDTSMSVCDLSPITLDGFGCTDPDDNLSSCVVSTGSLSGDQVTFTPVEGTNTIILTATDECGATAECTTTVTVILISPPVAVCPPNVDTTMCDFEEICVGGFSCDGDYVTCEVIGYTLTDGSVCFTPTAEGDYELKLVATGECGADTCITMVTVGLFDAPTLPDKTVDTVVCGPGIVCVELQDAVGGVPPYSYTYEGRPVQDTVCFDLADDATIVGEVIVTDSCGRTASATHTVNATVNTAPTISADPPGPVFLCEPDTICVPLTIFDPDNGLTVSSEIGVFNPADSTVCFYADTSGHYCDQVTVTDSCDLSANDSYCVDVTINSPPFCIMPGDTSIFACGPLQVCLDVSGDDPDGNLVGCEIISGPGTISNGQWCYTFSSDAEVTVRIRCTDECGAFCEGSFTITFDLNEGPTTGCPGYISQVMPVLEEICIPGFFCSDPDDNQTDCRIEGVTGTLIGDEVCFTPPGYGEYTIYLIAEDACGEADTCATIVDIVAPIVECPTITIEKTHNSLQGHFEEVSITIENPGMLAMGGFDFLIAYDATALSPSQIWPGQFLLDCGWEYFTYRFGVDGNCGNACPSGLLRIIALAETVNGANHPSCFGPPDELPHELARIEFYVTNDRTYECQYVPIYFFWMDCNDNAISTVAGDSLILVSQIYDFEGNLIWDEDDDDLFPDEARPPFVGVPDYCLVGDKLTPIRCMEVQNGGIDIICSDSIDARGDLNVNGVPYEVADAVMFTNYFINGLSAFGNHVEASIAASDVNADGISLSVADLVYLVRVVAGDAAPYAKPGPRGSFAVTTQVIADRLHVDYSASDRAGAVLLVFNIQGMTGTPILGSALDEMDIAYGVSGNELRVLIYDIGSGSIPAGEAELFSITTEGAVTLIDLEAADYYGNVMNTSTRIIPGTYVLEQNTPNPFNPATVISLQMPEASPWTISVFNIAGQLIREFTGYTEAGSVEVIWDGTDSNGQKVASGIYLYKAVAGDFVAARKMILMK